MFALKLTQIGNSVVLPKELLFRLHGEKGDTLSATESSEGVRLAPFDPAFEQQMDAARQHPAGLGGHQASILPALSASQPRMTR